MLNRIVAITLLIALISCNLSRFFVYAGFSFNQKYIAAQLCENKDRPWLHCNGHCYLMKKLRQAEEKEQGTERQIQKSLFQEAFFTTVDLPQFHNNLLQLINTPYQPLQPVQTYSAVFHPPQQV